MRFVRFGVTLERLQHRRLELIRQWRNSDWVRPQMRFQEFILPADQLRWFRALDPRDNWYFVACTEDVPCGLFHIKDIDWTRGCGEAGGFVGDQGYIGRPEPAKAILAMMDFAFILLQLQSLQAHYHSGLHRIAQFNQQLGYEVIGEEADGFLRARVTAERYFERAAIFRKAALALHGSSAVLLDPDPWLAEKSERLRAMPSPDLRLEL